MGELRDEDTMQTMSDPVDEVDGRLQLIVHVDGAFTTFRLPTSGDVSIGRSSKCDVTIDHPSVSRSHAVLTVGRVLRIRDGGSANGTRLGGARIGPGVDVPLAVGDAIAVGTAMVMVQRLSADMPPRRVQSHDYFEARIEEECARRSRNGGSFAVARVNLATGVELARAQDRLHRSLRAHDVLALYAPNQYEILFDGVTEDKAHEVAARIREELAVEGIEIALGMAIYPGDGATAGALFAFANDAVRGGGARESVAEQRAAPVSHATAMDGLHELAERVAASTISVLILGETGVGKEMLAESLHRKSPRSAAMFLRLNCAALSESLLESELFGHERGAFTGAIAQKRGLLETADGGTVFLDEVGELPVSTQVKLLRVIEERKVTRVGGLEERSLDVRFVAATNRDLEAEVARGGFRQDLFFRLNGITLVIPPLRKRVEEIEDLAEVFIEAATPPGQPRPRLSPAALAMLQAYSWPGNIRELRNVMDRATLLCRGGDIEPRHLPVEKMSAPVTVGFVHRSLPPPAPAPSRPAASQPSGFGNEGTTDAWPAIRDPSAPTNLKGELEALERQRILDALERCVWNQTKAAQLLGMSRGVLMARLDQYGIARPRKGSGTP
jgi:DNA-binding NtrC family response regulator